MAAIYQLDFLKTNEESRFECIENNLEKTKSSLDKVRKGTYARINQLESMIKDLEERQKIIERNICLQPA